jgi:hypothetical protein
MARSGISNSFENDQTVGDRTETSDADYRETIAFLQEEVARLEQELQSHHERQSDTALNDEVSVFGEVERIDTPGNGDSRSDEVVRFKAELATRDEAIRLLLDELSRVEETQEATRAEWEQLGAWVDELERRVDGQERDAVQKLERGLSAEKQKIEELKAKSEQDRHAWEVKRQVDQLEIARLQRELDQVAASPHSPGKNDGRGAIPSNTNGELVETLQAENVRLRSVCQELMERAAAAADRAESLNARMSVAVDEQNQLRRQLEQIEDERKCERLEYAANMADLQSQLAHTSLIQPVEPASPEVLEAIRPDLDPNDGLDPDVCIRSLRRELIDVQRQKQARRDKRLVNRIARLWSRTGPP